MIVSILTCLASLVALVVLIRRNQISLGLPIAYLFGLLLIHVPGALAHSLPWSDLRDSDSVATGIWLTAIGTLAFIAGVWLSRNRAVGFHPFIARPRAEFWAFCVVAGWAVTYALRPILASIPSVGAVIDKGGAVWMIGVMLGLRTGIPTIFQQGPKKAFRWLVAMLVFPLLMLLQSGFLSYGSAAMIVCLAILAVSLRSHWSVAAAFIVVSVFGVSLFVSYFQIRTEIRQVIWSGAALEERVQVTRRIIEDFSWIDLRDPDHLKALDRRLNQNYFTGLAAARLERNEVDYLYGRSVWEGALALIPRVIWPDKTVSAGSPKIVSEMTRLKLHEGTSFGIGNVMEFYVNFGIPGVVLGFFILGWVIGRLDLLAALAERDGDFSRLFLYFLPAVALIQPNGSIIELCSGSAAALLAAFGWSWGWRHWSTWREPRRTRLQIDTPALKLP